MAERPSKRQRRSVVFSDDDHDDSDVSGPTLRSSTRTTASLVKDNEAPPVSSVRTKKPTPKTIPTKSPSASPVKNRKHSKPKLDTKPNKSLHNFFAKVTEDQWRQRKVSTPEPDSQDLIVDDDIVDDDSLDDSVSQYDSQNDLKQTSAGIKRRLETGSTNFTPTSSQSSSHKFAKSTIPSKSSVSTSATPSFTSAEPEPHRPWADQYGPSSLEELAVNKKKVGDVQRWLEDVLSGRSRQKLLVLKGPAGSGKTSTIALLAKANGWDLVSWHNPTVSEAGTTSAIQQFGDFLARGGRFDALTFATNESQRTSKISGLTRVLLVEEFPATLTRSSGLLDVFRSTLLQYLASTSQTTQHNGRNPPNRVDPPVVMVVSETLLSSSTALADSFTAHRLLGPVLSSHPLLKVIEFNPIAPTFVQKALDLVIKKEAKISSRTRVPGPSVIHKLAEISDIRSAINSLEFLCARTEKEDGWSGTITAQSKGSSKNVVPMTDMEQKSLQLISQRESTLDMFHAAGKIVYNKREDPRVHDTKAHPPPKPPDHLLHLYTPKASQVDVEALLNETGTDIQTFISTIHENYVLSCNGDDFVDSLSGCSQVLSDSDIINPDSRLISKSKGNARFTTGNIQSGNSDALRQDEISFQVATRGLLFSLPHPVHRAAPPGARRQDSFKMFYPASLRLWKPTEEINDLISLHLHDATHESDGQFSRADGVAAWRSRGLAFETGLVAELSTSEDETVRLPQAYTSRENHVLEILPYKTKILSLRREDVQTLKKITQLRGIHISGEEPFDEELDHNTHTAIRPRVTAASKLGDRVEAAHRSIKILHARTNNSFTSISEGVPGAKGNNSELAQDVSMEKLYISDDDISD